MTGYIRTSSGSGGWKTVASYFVRISSGAGGWKSVTDGWVRITSGAGGWKRFFQSALTPSIQYTVTVSTNSSSYPATLTGTNYHWYDSTSLTYVFQKSSDGISWTNIGTATSISNPSVGSSNTVTRVLTTSDFPASTSYFRFTVTGVNSTYSTSFTSESTSVTVTAPATPGPVQNLTRTTGNGTAKTISWDAPLTGTTPYTYQINVDSTGWIDVTPSSTNTYQALTLASGIHTVQVRAVNVAGNGTSATTGSFTVPTITSGPTASSITGTTATISWGQTNENSYVLTVTGDPSSPYSGGAGVTAQLLSGLSAGTTYPMSLTITSISGDTATATGSFTTTSAPVNTVAPVASPSSGYVGSTTFSTTNGSWSGSPTSYAYQWQYDDSYPSGSTWLSISGATSSTYSPPSNYFSLGYTASIRCRVTATNSGGSTAAYSNTVTPVALTTPSAPQSLSRSTGNGGSKTFTWSAPSSDGGSTITSYQYQVDNLGWFTTSSSTSQSVTLAAGSHTFQVRAVNGVGAGTAASTGSFTVPTINSGPSASSITSSSATISWTASNQSTYSLSVPGDASSPYTGTTGTSVAISGLSASTTYTPTLTISSSTGDTATTTGSSFTTLASIPVIVVAPAVTPTSGTAGTTTFTSTSGTWSNSPTSYAYQWQYFSLSSFTYVSISGATSSTYLPPSNFNTLYYNGGLRCQVTASNTGGSATAVSNLVSVNNPVSVPSGGSVSLSGTGVAGTTITATTSGWSDSPTSYSVRIYASTTNPPTTSSGIKASSSTSSVSYTVTTVDASPPPYYFKAFATATNAAGTSTEVGSNVILSSLGTTVPGTVTSLTASSLLSGTNLNWSASWSAPASNGGSAITGYKVYVERGSSGSGPWTSTATQIPAGSGSYTQASPYSTASTSVSGRVTGTSSTWINVYVAAVNAVGTGSYTSASG